MSDQPHRCPFCGATLGANTSMSDGDKKPLPGSLGVCFYCAQILIFDDDLRERRPEPGELEEIYAQQPSLGAALRRCQRAVRAQTQPGRRV